MNIWEFLENKKEEEKEKIGWSQRMRGMGEIPKYEFGKEIEPKVEAKAGIGVKAEGAVKLEDKPKSELDILDELNESIEKNYKQYQSMTKKLETYQEGYTDAPDNIKPSIAANFNKLVKEHSDLVKQLEGDIAKRDSIISTKYKVAFSKYKQLTGLPGLPGKPVPGVEEKPKTFLEHIGVRPPAKPKELKMGIDVALGTWEERKAADPELQKTEDLAIKVLSMRGIDSSHEHAQIAYIYELLTGTPKEETIKDIQSNLERYGSISPPRDWKKAFKEEGILKTALIGPSEKYGEAESIRRGFVDIAIKKESPGADLISSMGWKGVVLMLGSQAVAGAMSVSPSVWQKITTKEIKTKLSTKESFRLMWDVNYGKATKAQRKIFDSIIEQAEKTGLGVSRVIKEGFTYAEYKPRFAFGGKLYAGVPIDEVVKAIVETGKITQDIANQLKVMNPVDTGLVFQQLSIASPAIASKLASQFVELIPQKITKIPKVEEEMTPEELEAFERLKEAKIIPEEEIEPTKEELKAIEKPPSKEEFMARMKEVVEAKKKLKKVEELGIEKVEKVPIEEPEKIEPEPTPEEIRAVFMDKENLETTIKNREFFLGKFGKLFTETKEVEDTLIKQKFNEMQMMVEYEEDEVFKLAFGKEKMRIPETTKTEWIEGLGKNRYMQIFRKDPNLQYPDEIASNLGISENELREQIIERIRTAPREVTLESAKQGLIDARDTVFMQVTAQMDAYRILLDEIEGGEYSFDTPKNIKRLNAKISALKTDSKKLMAKYEKEITDLQKEGIEKRFEELKKKTEAEKKVEVEIGIKKGLKVAKAELKGRAIKGMPKEEIKEGNKLIQRIQIMVKERGLTKKKFSDIKMTHGGARHLTGKTKRMTIPQLKAVFKAVEAARPRQIGWKKVLSLKTENKIQSLKDNLIDKLQMTEETYKSVLKDVGVYKEPRYIDAKHFITEKQGKDIIYRLIDEATILRTTLPYKQAVEKNPEIKKVIDKELSLIKPGDKKLKDPWEMNSMRVYFQKMGEITGESFYRLGQDLINTHSENKKKLHEFIEGFSEFKDVVRSEEAIKRVDDYIVCKSTLEEKPEYPKEITKQEIEMAKKVEGMLKDYEATARTLTFLNEIDRLEGIPQYAQYRKEINKAKDIYESKGFDDLVEYMKTQEFGIIKSGYSPLQVISPKVRLHEPRPTTFGKGHIKHRTDIEYKEQDKNILQRLFSYKKQMDNLVSMYPKVKALITLTDKNLDKFENPNRVKNVIELFLKELKGYSRPEGLVERTLNRAYSQSIQVIIMPSPVLSGRNLLQNPAFAFDKTILIDPRNKSLTADEVEYLNTYVSQMEVMKADWFLTGEKPYFGKVGEALIGLINKIGLYPRSDQGNRIWAFWAKINQVKRAFDKDVSLSKQMEEAKFSDMESSERIMALEILAKDGKEAMAKYIAKVYTDDTNFRYARYERSPAEMGKHKWFTNLMLFPRSYWELILKHGNKLKTGTIKEQGRAFKVLTNIIVGGLIVGAAYKKVTGRRENPYNPLVLLAYEPGGLAIGVIEAASDVYVNTIMALSGDDRAMAALTTAIPKLADMFIPFFNYTIRGYEAMIDKKNVDREALRKIRELLDKEYKVRGKAYIIERNAIEKWQYFLSGAGIDVAIKEREKEEKEKKKITFEKPEILKSPSILKVGKPKVLTK